jgi:hypothetical protein
MFGRINRITDKLTICSILDANMHTKNDILSAVFVTSKNTIYEAVHVLSKVTTGKEICYTFTNSDSRYMSPVVSCSLEDIKYVEVL